MEQRPSYPNGDIRRAENDLRKDSEQNSCASLGALISGVDKDSSAWEAGFDPGCIIYCVDGHQLRDIIDWRWLTDGDEIQLDYQDLDGETGSVVLSRQMDQSWGLTFDRLLFDEVKQCKNACTFCFMRQLPKGMRPSLYLRDDDFRLSFLTGTFVTLTNLSSADESRIIEQHISPLRVSLQALNPTVRKNLMGKNAERGIVCLERLCDQGIQCHCQIVLVPGVNDGSVLTETLDWAYKHPSILSVGIVPLGYTAHQKDFDHSFNRSSDALEVLQSIEPFQKQAQEERGVPWVYCADEFYRNAYGADILNFLPGREFYGDYELFEDGIGIIRSTVDDWHQAKEQGILKETNKALKEIGKRAYLVCGFAQKEYLDALLQETPLSNFVPLYVKNNFFGGNVDVTGLLCGCDIICELSTLKENDPNSVVFLPSIIFNDDGLTLDDMTLDDLEDGAGIPLSVVSLSPLDYFKEIAAYVFD